MIDEGYKATGSSHDDAVGAINPIILLEHNSGRRKLSVDLFLLKANAR